MNPWNRLCFRQKPDQHKLLINLQVKSPGMKRVEK